MGEKIKRDSANRRGQDASNPSMMATSAESLSNTIISQTRDLSTPSDKNISETDDSSLSYTPTKEESNDELLTQYEDGAITREEYLELLRGKTPKNDPVSLANMTPDDFDMNTTPSFQRYYPENQRKKIGKAKRFADLFYIQSINKFGHLPQIRLRARLPKDGKGWCSIFDPCPKPRK